MSAEPGEDLLPTGETLYEIDSDPRSPAGVFKPGGTMTRLGEADEYQFFSIAAPMLFGGFRMEVLHDFCGAGSKKLVALAFPKPWLRLPPGTLAPPQLALTASHLLLGVERPLVPSLERVLCSYLMPLGNELATYPAGRIDIPDPLYLTKRALIQEAPPHYELLYFGVQTPQMRAFLKAPTKAEDMQASLVLDAIGDTELSRLSATFVKTKHLSVDDISTENVEETKRKFDEIVAKSRNPTLRKDRGKQ